MQITQKEVKRMKFNFVAEGDNRKMKFGIGLEKEEGEQGFFESLQNRSVEALLTDAEGDSEIIDIVEDEDPV